MPSRTDLAIAAACAAWAAAFLLPTGAAVVAAPAFGVALVARRRAPVGAALGVAAIAALAFGLGLPKDNPAALAAALAAAFALGRSAPAAHGAAAIGLLVVALTLVQAPAAIDAVFVGLVLGAAWLGGRAVSRRAAAARRAIASAEELRARDQAAITATVVAEERARLAGEALRAIRTAVERMRRDALDASDDLDPARLSAVQDSGRDAVAELRRLLGLLRDTDLRGRSTTDAAPPATRLDRRAQLQAAALVAGLAALTLVDILVAEHPPTSPGQLVLTLVFAAAGPCALWRPRAAALMATTAAAGSLLSGTPLTYGFATPATILVVSAACAATARPTATAALFVAAATTQACVLAQSPENAAVTAATFALGALAGLAWHRHDRRGAAATATAHRIHASHDAAARRALIEQRRQLARELHDVASHSVGVMVLQAGAALANRTRSPDAAHAAVRAVLAAADESLRELDTLADVLTEGEWLSTPSGPDLGASLSALVDRMRRGGLDIKLSAPLAPIDDPEVAAATYRVVQESLTNAARHAPGSAVEISISDADAELAVTVRDSGCASPARPSQDTGSGFGLVGLAERVRALDGDLAAGPLPAGGFVVSARFPRHLAAKAHA